jgi:stearoyl-CoA desaturase (delta-9 desaturase)
MKPTQQVRLASLLENFQSLRVVYQFRVRLQEIWSRSTLTQKELLDALQEWCHQAEATRIEVLTRFSSLLKTYVPQSG